MQSATFLGAASYISLRVQAGQARQPRPSHSVRHNPVLAFANSRCAENYGQAGEATYERILRYPDGRERRIRYPAPCEEGPTLDSGEEWITLNVWKASRGAPPSTSYRRTPLDASSSPTTHPDTIPQTEREEPETRPPSGEIPDSPLALLRFFTSDAHRDAQRREWDEVRDSYDILRGCPWPAPRPLYVLAVAQAEGEAGLTHTLRTQLPRADMEDELTRLLGGRTRPNGESIIKCGEMADGVVTFESEEDAESYGEMLEESGVLGVHVVRCDSHELFRQVNSVKGVVVMHRLGSAVPPVHKLSAVLRGQTSLDDGGPQAL